MKKQSIVDLQKKILEIIAFIDSVCRENDIEYFIMGGTALGAVRHGGFIPWDDDLDIFMKPVEYLKFKEVLSKINNPNFYLQEWKTADMYLEHAKLRMNSTTYIEANFAHRKDIHQGIFVDIMILHKAPNKKRIQRKLYFCCKYVTLYGISQRNWKPKNFKQKLLLFLTRLTPRKLITKQCYKMIYKYDDLKNNYSYFYWITPASFRNGLFDRSFFDESKDIAFENLLLKGPNNIKGYLEYRYGDYMTLPPVQKRNEAIHAIYYDTETDYKVYLDKID